MVESKARMPEMNAQRLCMDAKPTKRSYGKGDSSFCRTALLGFAIRVGTPVNMNEGKNQVIRKTTAKQLQSPPSRLGFV